jgi:hypothetical protein
MEKVGIFFGHLEFIEAIRYILWPFGNLVAIWYNSPPFGILCQEKSGNPGAAAAWCTSENGNKAIILGWLI